MAIYQNQTLRLELRIIKRGYCPICGLKLKRKIIFLEHIYTYKPFFIPFLKERKGKSLIITPAYYCKKCDYFMEYNSQKQISVMQKENNSYILSDGKKIVDKLKIKE